MTNSFSVMTYSPTDVKLIVAGYPVAGWETISISRVSPGFQPIYGIRGKDTRSKNPKTSSVIRVTTLMLSLIHISEPTRRLMASRMPSSA